MNLCIVVLYSPADSEGMYTDVYSDPIKARKNDAGYGVLVGYGVLDRDSGYMPDEAKDFCETLEEAESDLKSVVEKLRLHDSS